MNKYILCTNGLSHSNVRRINAFCTLLKSKLSDQWVVSEDMSHFDVLIKEDLQLNEVDAKTAKQTIYLVSDRDWNQKHENNQDLLLLRFPFNGAELVSLLNKASKLIMPKTISHRIIEKIKSLHIKKHKEKQQELAQVTPINNHDKGLKKSRLSNLIKMINPWEGRQLKVVFLGRPGAGKTTAIHSASEGGALTTEVKANDSTAVIKENTTIGIDYAEFNHKQTKLRLYGTPGQLRYDYMRNLTLERTDIFIVLLDLSSQEPLSELAYFNKIINTYATSNELRFIVLTHSDMGLHDPKKIMLKIKKQIKEKYFFSQLDPRNERKVKLFLSKIIEYQQALTG